ncbi:MAG: NAD+ synthase [Candidatus Omnitrophota bacterium]
MLRIGLAQINVTVGDLEGNRNKIIEYIKRAKQFNINIVVFPELALTGYPPEDLLLKDHFIKDNFKALNRIIQETENTLAIIGFVDRDKAGRLYNAAAVIYHKKLKGVYRKMELPNYGVFDEKRYFTPGTENKVFAFGDHKLGISICEDIWHPQGPCRQQVKAGANLLINLSSSPYQAGKAKMRGKFLSQQAKKNKASVAYVNLIGGQDELVFDGASLIIDPKGKIVASGKSFEEDLVTADLALPVKSRASEKDQLKMILIEKDLKIKGKLLIKGKRAKPLSPTEEIYKALVLGTRDYVLKNGFKKVVLGLSGGIDSSLVATIACDALGAQNVIGVTMPSRFTSSETRYDALRLADNLRIQDREVPIDSIYEAYLKTLKEEFLGLDPDTTEENIQARIRGNILMAFSNKFGWLVLTTGNKSEVAVGYCTLYGDMAGGFAVIKDIPKTLVYRLARYRNSLEKKELIAPSILKRPPTAELRKNQKDQDSLPPYDVLDKILEAYVEKDKSLSKIKGAKTNEKLICKVTRMVDRMEYKRRQSPPGVKITPRAFGKDRRLPITNRYKEY